MFVSRRSFLAALLLPVAPIPGGRFVGNAALGRLDGKPAPPLGVLMDAGLDARRFTDLSTLTPGDLVTPSDRFFVRTAAGASQARADGWVIDAGGGVARPQTFTLGALAPLERSAGTHLLECAGNTDPANFGLMSTARWDGIPVAALLDTVSAKPGRWRVQITGTEPADGPARSSVRGASWIFHRDDLERTGAFLATRMNGAPLPADNGFPVRLVVPGWYGCSCIKWVSHIELVPEDAPATTQMIEFSRRTHQDGQPSLAAEYAPPVIDLAATPVRVEQWIVDGAPVYRVVGIVWGGERPARSLSIRFHRNEPFVPVSDYQPPASTTAWAMWTHVWKPADAGVYRIALRTEDTAVRTRRLDMFFYLREVRIERV